MDFFFIIIISIIASFLTLFSGFGLGTLLLPAMLIILPSQEAVIATAIVHFLNNIFKFMIFGKSCKKDVLIKFGITAILASFVGAKLLVTLANLPPILNYELLGYQKKILPLTFIISLLILIFAIYDLYSVKQNLKFGKNFLPIGGLVSGFLGGLSGHQGAMRSAFLANAGLTKDSFIGTGVTIACLVDMARITVYGLHISSIGKEHIPLMTASCISALLGVFMGKHFLKTVTMEEIQKIVGIGLILLSIALAIGII
tara:strand:+ start:38302 stop:39072 length:771 start_codon:yes stop_codon:yes gene_type:complete